MLRYHQSPLYLSSVKTSRCNFYLTSHIPSSLLPVPARCPWGIIDIKQTTDRGGYRLYVLLRLFRLHITLPVVCVQGY